MAFVIKMAEVIFYRGAKLAMLFTFACVIKPVGYGDHRKNTECPDGIQFTEESILFHLREKSLLCI